MDAVTTQPVNQSPAITQLGVSRPSVPSNGVAVVQAKHCDHCIGSVSKFQGLVPVAHAVESTSGFDNCQPLEHLRKFFGICDIE